MLIDFKAMLNKLTTPRPGFTVVKLTTASNVGLYVRDLGSESKLIKTAKDNYVFHLQPGDVILQGSYTRSQKIKVVNDLKELNGNYTMMQLESTSNFYPMIDIPHNYRRKHIDDSLNEITKVLLSLINEKPVETIQGIDFHPLCDIKFTVVPDLAVYEEIKAKRSSFVEVARIPHQLKVLLSLNHNGGTAEFIIWNYSGGDAILATNVELSKGVRLAVEGKYASLVIDTELFQLGNDVLDQIIKPYKREEEAQM